MKIKHVSVLFLSMLLGGCVAAVVAGATAGLVVYDTRSVGVIERDARIFYVINTAIVRDHDFKNSSISVDSFNQDVLLTGQTPKASLRVQAEKIARDTPRVRRVYDEITIGSPISLSQKTKDAWIAGEVRTKMLTAKYLSSGSIRIVVENGVVYLMGIVMKEQSQLAVDVARRIKGVKKVVKVFRYIS